MTVEIKGGGFPRILVADDNSDMRMLVIAHIKAQFKDAKIHQAGNGGAAVEKFKMYGPFDLVITDFQMPVFNGDGVCNKIREVDKDVPIVCNTSDPPNAEGTAPFTAVFDKCHGGTGLIEYLKNFCPGEALDK